MALFTIGEHDYRSDKLDALTQFNVSRRIIPVVIALAPLIIPGATEKDIALLITSDLSRNVALIQPALEAVAKMPDDDVNYVLAKCASRVFRANKNPSTGAVDSWSPIWNSSAKSLQYDDLGMVDLITIVWNVLRENLEGFFSESRSSSTG